MSVALFRGMVLASWALALLGAFADQAWPDLLSEELAMALANLPPPAGLDSESLLGDLLAGGLALLLLAGGLAASVAVCFFKRWGRAVMLWSTPVALAVVVWMGPTVMSGVAAALYELSSMLWGAVLAAAYWSPLSARFVRT